MLCDVRAQIEHQAYSPIEIAARYHHRLVAIHVFPNGNGRHARLMADLLLTELAGRRFEWGRGSLVAANELRALHRCTPGGRCWRLSAPSFIFGKRVTPYANSYSSVSCGWKTTT
jgi:fido (protein-threonine AMPylation protein)